MSPWFIFALVLWPFVVAPIWLFVAQRRGWLEERSDAQPGFFQRHSALWIALLVTVSGFLMGGIIGVVVSALLLFVLSLITSAIMTALEGRRHRSQIRALQAASGGADEPHLDPWPRRLGRNFRGAIDEWLSFWP